MWTDYQDYLSEKVKFAVKLILLHPEYPNVKKFLVLKKDPAQYTKDKRYDLPGGNVSPTESHETALKRELEEETKMKLNLPVTPVAVQSGLNPETQIYSLFIAFVSKAISDKVEINPEEHVDYAWYTLEEFINEAGKDNYVVPDAKKALKCATLLY